MLVTHPGVGAKTMKDFIAFAKANPAKANYGSPGVGSFSHLAGEWLASESGNQDAARALPGAGAGGETTCSAAPSASCSAR